MALRSLERPALPSSSGTCLVLTHQSWSSTDYKYHKDDDCVGPFNLCDIVKALCFSAQQKRSFFELIEPSHYLTDEIQRLIMDYSHGAPGAVGSLIRFSIDHGMNQTEGDDWESWFTSRSFAGYLNRFHWLYSRIQRDRWVSRVCVWRDAVIVLGSSIL